MALVHVETPEETEQRWLLDFLTVIEDSVSGPSGSTCSKLPCHVSVLGPWLRLWERKPPSLPWDPVSQGRLSCET